MKTPFTITGDEHDDHRAFEEYVGGVHRAERLFQIYKNSYPTHNRTKVEVFRSNALREGFSNQDIDALLLLQ